MAHRIIWSSRALADVESLAAYIAADSPAYARIVVKKIITATRKLSRFPNLGREVPEFLEQNIRELFAYIAIESSTRLEMNKSLLRPLYMAGVSWIDSQR